MSRRWWENSGIDLEGARKREAASSTTRLVTESEEESDGEHNGIAGGGEKESLGASGSSGEEWSREEDDLARTYTSEGSITRQEANYQS